ncbi:MAG: glucosaminidase domain-containing protein [Pseudomonadales bacterium]|nr:glucosaminidase domain-containing protein [Pseudomonadales bacterium]
MNQKRNLVVSALILGGFFSSHALVVQSITHEASNGAVAEAAVTATKKQVLVPNFSAISNIKERKTAFFDFLGPLVEKENQRIAELRANLDDMSTEQLIALSSEYDLPQEQKADLVTSLKSRIDEIPPSLVMAQAAIESAWGTSRFAQEGNNLFGEWCFTPGCGIVPKARPANKHHEVRRFDSPEHSVRSYMQNLNSHNAYDLLRIQRADQRARQSALNGCYLATGLQSYSQKGLGYVEMVKTFIRSNRLEENRKDCAPTVIAEPDSAPATESTTNESA